MVSTDPVWYYFPPWMLWQNRGMWSRRNSVCSESRPKAFDMSSGIPKLPITSWSVDNIYNRVLCCKSISINYNMHGWFLCWQHATGWVWWKSGLRAVAMWSSSSFTKRHFLFKKKRGVRMCVCVCVGGGGGGGGCVYGGGGGGGGQTRISLVHWNIITHF